MENILAPLDFSPVTERVIHMTAHVARAFHSKVWLIHVAPAEPYPADYDAGPQEVRDTVAENLRCRHQDLQTLAERLRDMDIETTPLLIQGEIVDEILSQAKKCKADCIILGTHGNGGLFKRLLGSISEGVLRKTVCPVLFVQAEG